MNSRQIQNLETFLSWLKTSPINHNISSMNAGFIHVRFDLSTFEEKKMKIKLYTYLISTLSIALLFGINIMFFFGDVVHYMIPMEKGIGFYVMAGASNVTFLFVLAILIYVSHKLLGGRRYEKTSL